VGMSLRRLRQRGETAPPSKCTLAKLCNRSAAGKGAQVRHWSDGPLAKLQKAQRALREALPELFAAEPAREMEMRQASGARTHLMGAILEKLMGICARSSLSFRSAGRNNHVVPAGSTLGDLFSAPRRLGLFPGELSSEAQAIGGYIKFKSLHKRGSGIDK
jgi:hypothetical protein